MCVCVCAAHSDLHSVALLRLLPLPLPVPQLGLRLLQAPLGDFPECLDPVPLQLEVAPLLPLSVQLLSEADDVVLQLSGFEVVMSLTSATPPAQACES